MESLKRKIPSGFAIHYFYHILATPASLSDICSQIRVVSRAHAAGLTVLRFSGSGWLLCKNVGFLKESGSNNFFVIFLVSFELHIKFWCQIVQKWSINGY
jgi:hypothetical protein